MRIIVFVAILFASSMVTSVYLFFMGNFCVVKLPFQFNIYGYYCAEGSALSDWQWLVGRLNKALPISDWITNAPLIFLIVFVLGVVSYELATHSAKNKTVFGKFGSKNLHGDAQWAVAREIKRANLLKQDDGGVVVGVYVNA